MDYNALKKAVKLKGYTLEQFAQEVGYTPAGFHRSIRNNSFSVKAVEKMAEVLGISVCDLFTNMASVKPREEAPAKDPNAELVMENLMLKEKIAALSKQIELQEQIISLLKK